MWQYLCETVHFKDEHILLIPGILTYDKSEDLLRYK